MLRNLLVILILFGNALYSQESVNLRFGGGASYMNYYYSELDNDLLATPDITVSENWGVNFDANIEFRVHKNFQFETGIGYQQFAFDYTFYRETDIANSIQSTTNAKVKQTNSVVLLPFGGSLVLPLKKGEFLLGAKFFAAYTNSNKKGTWHYYGMQNIDVTDSMPTYEEFDETYIDNEIGDVFDPKLKIQYHLAYQHNIADKWQVFAKLMAGNGLLSDTFGLKFWQYSGQVGVVYKLIDYKDKTRLQESKIPTEE